MSAADWKPYDVPRLAGLLAEQPTDSGTHAMAWQQAYDTLTDQRQRIQAARAALAHAWPPTSGSAAASFLDQVDALTQAMTNTADSAVNAHSALAGIMTAIDNATTTVDTLHQTWQQNQTTIGGVVPTNDWTQPLNDQAHTAMAHADTAIAEHATDLVAPAPYTPQIRIETLDPIGAPAGRSTLTQTATEQSRAEIAASAAPRSPNLQDNGSATPGGEKTQMSTPTPWQVASTPLLTESTSTAAANGINASDSSGAAAHGVAPDGAAEPSTEHGRSGELVNSPEFEVRRSHPMALGVAGGFAAAPTNGGRFGPSGAPNSTMETTPGVPQISMSTYSAAAPNAGSTFRSLSPDGTIAPDNSGHGSHTTSAELSGSAEPIPFGSIASSGSSTSLSRGGRDAAGRDRVQWTMAQGVPPIIEAQIDQPVLHEPGTGVIGIDR